MCESHATEIFLFSIVLLLRSSVRSFGEFLRQGASHSWWQNASLNKRSAIPRHSEINDILVRKICKDLGIAHPNKTKPITVYGCSSGQYRLFQ
jgi:mRNA interferase HicA